ncbi:hypothetical protein BD1_23 [Octadecabacter Antarctic BD virus 1]|nr:hypothetical protein BD1_23 [Octadecabacter Antarctic BD virus 1]
MHKSGEWLVLVGVLSLYLFMRGSALRIWERLASVVVSAGLAYAGSSAIATYTRDSELLAAILIMVAGPFLLGAALNVSGDEAFLKRLMQDWARKRLGLEAERRDDET